MKKIYVKEIAKMLDEIDESINLFDCEKEVKARTQKIRSILLTS